MHTAGTPGGSASRRTLVGALVIIGVLAVLAGILYLAGTANSLHFMTGKVHKGNHDIRAAVSLVVGVACLAGAWVATRSRQ